MTDKWTDIGRVRSVQPKQRIARIELLPSYRSQVEAMTWLFTRLHDGTLLRSRVLKAQDRGDGLLVTFKPPSARRSLVNYLPPSAQRASDYRDPAISSAAL